MQQDTPTTTAADLTRKAIPAGVIGNVVEWYDFFTYSFLATTLAAVFFPSEDPTIALLATFAVFGVAFLMRPLGALLFGHLGDKVGRRTTLATVILTMSSATLAIALLPTYASVGVLAPILLVVCRCLQGFSTGGEFVGAAALVIEYSPDDKRNTYGSIVTASTALGALLSASVVAVLTTSLPGDALESWAWRIPFLIAGPLGLVGLYLRLRLEETPAFRQLESRQGVERAPIGRAFRSHYKELLLLFSYVATNGLTFYLLGAYNVTYLSETLGFGATAALLANGAGLLFYGLMCLVWGIVSDRIGRRPVLLASCFGFLIFSVPSYLLAGQGSVWAAALGQCLLALWVAASGAVVTVSLVELFPASVRYSGSAIAYNGAYLLFAGTAPYLATLLVDRTGSNLAPAFYVTAVALATTLVVLLVPRETRGVSIVEAEPERGGAHLAGPQRERLT